MTWWGEREGESDWKDFYMNDMCMGGEFMTFIEGLLLLLKWTSRFFFFLLKGGSSYVAMLSVYD